MTRRWIARLAATGAATVCALGLVASVGGTGFAARGVTGGSQSVATGVTGGSQTVVPK